MLGYQACAVLDATSYAAYVASEERLAFPEDSPLPGWITAHGNLSAHLPSAQETDLSDISLGRNRRAQLQNFAARNEDRHEARAKEWERWKSKGEEIQAGRSRAASKRELASLVKAALSLPDSLENIRKKL